MAGYSSNPDSAGPFPRVSAASRYQLLEIVIDQNAVNNLLARIRGVPGAARRVFPPAMNKAAAEFKTWLAKAFSERINIQRKASIRDRLTLYPKASSQSMASGVRIAMTRFVVTSFKGTRQVKAGIQWQPRPGATQIIPRAFIRQGLTHYQTGEYMEQRMAWRRAGPMGQGARLVPRKPLFVMRGPSLGRVFTDDPTFQGQAENRGRQILEKKIASQVDRIAAEFRQ